MSSEAPNAIRDKNDARKFLSKRHPEYAEFAELSAWILDTLEGGPRYRDAIYRNDRLTGKPVRNLIRLQRELPVGILSGPFGEGGNYVTPEGIEFDLVSGSPFFSATGPDNSDPALRDAGDEVFELRRARTPVPNFLSSFIEKQLAKIYKRPITKEGSPELMAWAADIDGRKTTLEEWMRETIAPLFCALGMIDMAFDHPRMQEGEPVLFGRSADVNKQCTTTYILPENMLWWRLDYTGRYYIEAVVREIHLDDDHKIYVDRYRHWTHEDWTLYERDGTIKDEGIHPYGMVPIVRCIDRLNFRTDHTSNPRMYGIVDLSRSYYNEESELIANQTLHNCPLLEGPADDNIDSPLDDSVPVGRNLMLRRVVNREGVESGYKYIEASALGAEFTRLRLNDLQTRMEHQAALTRSIGSVGHGGSQGVAQSGISKAYDQSEGSDYLSSVARALQGVHYTAMFFALTVLHDGDVPPEMYDKIRVTYPQEFNLLTFNDVALIDETIQNHMKGEIGAIPTLDKETLKMLFKRQHPDMPEDRVKEIEDEIDQYVDEAAKRRKDKLNAPPIVAPGFVAANGAAGPNAAGSGGAKLPVPLPPLPNPAAMPQAVGTNKKG